MKICINCGSEYFGKGNKYCTYKCQQDFQYKESVKIWLNGGHVFKLKMILNESRNISY